MANNSLHRGNDATNVQQHHKTQEFYGGRAENLEVAGLILSESEYPAGFRMPRHQHEPSYFGLVIQGGYRETLGLGLHSRELSPQSTVYHPRGESHAVKFLDTRVRIFRIEIGEKWWDRVNSYSRIPDEPYESNGGILASLTMKLYGEFRRRDAWSALSMEGLFLEVIAEIARQSFPTNEPSIPQWLSETKEILSGCISNTPTLAELGNEVGVHPIHLAREFRRHFGCTVGEFVRQRRVDHAMQQLAISTKAISEIALETGFYDQSHFSNTFKKHTGMSPAAYRATCGNC